MQNNGDVEFYQCYLHNNENKFLCLAYRCRNDVANLDKFNANGVFIFSFRKHAFTDRVYNLMLLGRNVSNVAIFSSDIFHINYSWEFQL